MNHPCNEIQYNEFDTILQAYQANYSMPNLVCNKD